MAESKQAAAAGQEVPPPLQMLQMITGYWISKAIYVAAELGIADRVLDGPEPCEALARATGANPDALYRVMRALASVGVFAEDAQGRFGLTPLAECLVSDRPGSMRSMAIMNGAESYEAWTAFMHSVKTGEPAWEQALGKPIFEYYQDHPEQGRIFDQAMTGWSQSTDDAVASTYDFSKCRRVMDVAGGRGTQLAAILRAHPQAQGVLFDRPAVIEAGSPITEDPELGPRIERVGGDFFRELPRDIDACVLKHVLHDWDDAEAGTILRNCLAGLTESGRVLVVETVIPRGNDPEWSKLMDLEMLVIGGRERTAEQYRSLFESAGLKLEEIHPVPGPVALHVIEGARA